MTKTGTNTSYPKEKINILFLENISDTAVKHFTATGYSNVKKLSGALSEEQLISEIKNVHLLGIRSKTKITQKKIEIIHIQGVEGGIVLLL